MGLLDSGYELFSSVLDKHNLNYISKKFDSIFLEGEEKIKTNLNILKKTIPEDQSFEFSKNKERLLIENLEIYKKNGNLNLICVHNVEEYYPEIKEFFFNAIYDRVINELSLEGKFLFDKINFIKKTDNDNHSMDWHRDSQFCENNFYKNIVVGVYLDKSLKNRDAVSFIPGSHKVKIPPFKKDNVETIEANPGDVLVHIGSVYHESPCTSESFMRRTIYYRFLYEQFE